MDRIFKVALKVMIDNYVRAEYKITFLEELYIITNKYAGSTFWGVVQDLLNEYKGSDK